MRHLLSLLLISLSICCYAQNDNVLPQRQAYKLSLPIDKGSVYEMDVPATLYVQKQDIVQIYPGETIYLEAEEKEGKLLLTSVKKIEHPERTLTITCTQNVSKKRHEGIMLKVANPFNRDLIYSATIFLMEANKWVKTSVVPVRAGISSFEMWHDVIITLGLSDWKLASK